MALAAMCAFAAGGAWAQDGDASARGPVAAPQTRAAAEAPKAAEWKFAVSGDSRNCGDVVMPAIAGGVRKDGASFYWHLGDFRKIIDSDEDIEHQPEHLKKPLGRSEYEALAWNDFLESQIAPFGSLPVYLAIGNHETIPPKTRQEYLVQFGRWLDTPELHAQRLRDDPQTVQVKTYYHWTNGGIDFITLDNATPDEFDAEQMKWLETILRADEANPAIRTIVVGMHEALPESISKGHSMNQSSEIGSEAGRHVYADLLQAQDAAHKRVYVLASHSHYFMDGIFDTAYWRDHGGILPGWIVGTAGAQRYSLPPDSKNAREAETNVYGFLLATAKADGEIEFTFRQVHESDVPVSTLQRYGAPFVHWCFAENSSAR